MSRRQAPVAYREPVSRYDARRDEFLVLAFPLDAFGLGAREGRATPGEPAAVPD